MAASSSSLIHHHHATFLSRPSRPYNQHRQGPTSSEPPLNPAPTTAAVTRQRTTPPSSRSTKVATSGTMRAATTWCTAIGSPPSTYLSTPTRPSTSPIPSTRSSTAPNRRSPRRPARHGRSQALRRRLLARTLRLPCRQDHVAVRLGRLVEKGVGPTFPEIDSQDIVSAFEGNSNLF
ncbi:hypothetical protein Dsin_014402 [Dipteronia sinensis]|uniref:Uncharacterized protein n=1 Tax=Dipteronia sinensis TaxID=43782 RepID=A0AAE0EAA0_9ROSI|nr:hypothetical protein Dsin_014402 [Dipteronia sinensis]